MCDALSRDNQGFDLPCVAPVPTLSQAQQSGASFSVLNNDEPLSDFCLSHHCPRQRQRQRHALAAQPPPTPHSSPQMQLITPASSVLLVLALPALSSAYTWNFKSTPQECSDLTVEVSGSGGTPPYRILIVPYGGTPFSNGSEVRKIFETPFDNDATSVTFKLNYPENSQFIAVVRAICDMSLF